MLDDLDQLVLAEAPGGVIVTTRDRTIVRWTNGAERIFGYGADEALGNNLWSLISLPGQADADSEIGRKLDVRGNCDYEMLRKKKDGSLIYIDASCVTIPDEQGQIQYIVSTTRDRTQLKAMRDAQLMEAKFRNVFESTPDSIIVTNLTGTIVLANTRTDRLFGYKPNELVGQRIELLLPERFRDTDVGHRTSYIEQSLPSAMGAGLELHKDYLIAPAWIGPVNVRLHQQESAVTRSEINQANSVIANWAIYAESCFIHLWRNAFGPPFGPAFFTLPHDAST